MDIKKDQAGAVGRALRRVRVKPHMVSVSEARRALSVQLDQAKAGQDVVILTNSKPEGVLMSYERYEALLDYVEDLEDRLSIVDRDEVTVSFADAVEDLDL